MIQLLLVPLQLQVPRLQVAKFIRILQEPNVLLLKLVMLLLQLLLLPFKSVLTIVTFAQPGLLALLPVLPNNAQLLKLDIYKKVQVLVQL